VSHGTLRAEDLIPRFLEVAGEVRLPIEARKRVRRLASEWAQHAENADRLKGWWSEEALQELFDILNDAAPPFAHFGSIEGDGACFGFWVSDESLKEAVDEGEVLHVQPNGWRCGSKTFHPGPEPGRAELLDIVGTVPSFRLVVDDHGGMELFSRSGKSVWRVV
jgi:hypothetical protein